MNVWSLTSHTSHCLQRDIGPFTNSNLTNRYNQLRGFGLTQFAVEITGWYPRGKFVERDPVVGNHAPVGVHALANMKLARRARDSNQTPVTI